MRGITAHGIQGKQGKQVFTKLNIEFYATGFRATKLIAACILCLPCLPCLPCLNI